MLGPLILVFAQFMAVVLPLFVVAVCIGITRRAWRNRKGTDAMLTLLLSEDTLDPQHHDASGPVSP